jgi:hypothetical protein
MTDSMVERGRALYERTFRDEKRKVTPWLALPDWARLNWIKEAERQAAGQVAETAGALAPSVPE